MCCLSQLSTMSHHDSKVDAAAQAKLDAKMDAADRHAINTIRVLAADMVQKPNSGHPGMPMVLLSSSYLVFKLSARCWA